uniref:Uncharacterized protein n=1 Tax=Spiroplasma kunkelii TaxID=47834 RepID=Q6XYS8_SPIKU|nr:hypothetical protein [Spiroplasma kunkelii CR2-3x]
MNKLTIFTKIVLIKKKKKKKIILNYSWYLIIVSIVISANLSIYKII